MLSDIPSSLFFVKVLFSLSVVPCTSGIILLLKILSSVVLAVTKTKAKNANTPSISVF
ncbi:MAG: hypothetical protein H0X03_05950 [Nitrosopumilus sp.]|nr:hypothetical protein [Nitrosopumilus sp.]